MRDIDAATVALTPPAINKMIRPRFHRRDESRAHARREERRERAPLQVVNSGAGRGRGGRVVGADEAHDLAVAQNHRAAAEIGDLVEPVAH